MIVSTTKLKTFFSRFLSLLVIFLIWQILSLVINSDLILPAPKIVAVQIGNKIIKASFWKSTLNTFLRVLISFLISCIFGFIFGVLCGAKKFIRDFFDIPLAILRTTPVIALIVLALFWFNSNLLPVFISSLVTIPIVITTTSSAIKNSLQNKDFIIMANSYGFSKVQKFIYIELASAKSVILSCFESCFGLTWKIVIAGEVMCIPAYGVGSQLQIAQIHLNTSEVMAETIIIIIISFMMEQILKSIFRVWK